MNNVMGDRTTNTKRIKRGGKEEDNAGVGERYIALNVFRNKTNNTELIK